MKICKCVKCKREFEMEDNFMGTILCEDCDPFMNEQSMIEKLEADKAEITELLHDAIGLLMNHAQHEDAGWISDYEKVIKKYEQKMENKMTSKGWENNTIFPVIKNTDNKDMTSQEIFEKKTGRPATYIEHFSEGEHMVVYEADYVLMLEEQRELVLEALKAIDEAVNDNCIPDAQMIIKNTINQVSGEQE